MSRLGVRFDRLFAATVASNLGDGVGRTAMPLLAASLTRDPVLVSALTAALYLPWLLFALPAGALVDRTDRRLAFSRATMFRAAVMTALTVLVATDIVTIWLLLASAFLLGAGETVSDSSAQAMVPAVVAADRLDVANGRLQGAMLVGDAFVGAPLGGFLFAAAAATSFLAAGTGYLVAALFLVSVAGSLQPSNPTARSNLRTEIRDGLRWLVRDRFIRWLTLIAAALGLMGSATASILVLFAIDKLGLDERGFALFVTWAAVGGLLGSTTAPRLIGCIGRGAALALAVGIAGVAHLGIGVSSHAVVAGCFEALFAWSVVLWNVVSMSARQQLIPDHLLGRVLGAWRTVVWGCMPVGAALGGILSQAIDLRAPFFLAAAVHAVLIGPTVMLVRRLPAGAHS